MTTTRRKWYSQLNKIFEGSLISAVGISYLCCFRDGCRCYWCGGRCQPSLTTIVPGMDGLNWIADICGASYGASFRCCCCYCLEGMSDVCAPAPSSFYFHFFSFGIQYHLNLGNHKPWLCLVVHGPWSTSTSTSTSTIQTTRARNTRTEQIVLAGRVLLHCPQQRLYDGQTNWIKFKWLFALVCLSISHHCPVLSGLSVVLSSHHHQPTPQHAIRRSE